MQHPQYDRAQSNPWMGSLFGAPKDSLRLPTRPVSLFFILRFLSEREAKTKILIKIKLKVKEKISAVCGNALRGCSVLFFVVFAVYFVFEVMSVCKMDFLVEPRWDPNQPERKQRSIFGWKSVHSTQACVCVCDGDNRERVPRGGGCPARVNEHVMIQQIF